MFKINKNKEDIFIVIIMAAFGDALVGNSLFQNIKRIYPNSKTVFIINKPFYEVAKYQKDVDEVFVYDKNGMHKGFMGMIRFVRDFPYKNAKCIFKMCRKTRVDLLSFLLRPKQIINYNVDLSVPTHERFCNLLKNITKEEIIACPIEYIAESSIPKKFEDIISSDKKYTAICPISSNYRKDMPIETAAELIEKLNYTGNEVILVGAGKAAEKYSKDLEEKHCNFINLVNKTSIYELAQILRNCEGLISVDTGTMHLGYANRVPTVCVFYIKENITGWAPSSTLYPYTILPDTNSVKDIYDSYKKVILYDNKKVLYKYSGLGLEL